MGRYREGEGKRKESEHRRIRDSLNINTGQLQMCHFNTEECCMVDSPTLCQETFPPGFQSQV